MTTRKEALIALRDKVRDGELPRGDISGAAFDIDLLFPLRRKVGDAYSGSVDAALALCEAVLPEWDWDVSSWGGTDDRASAKLQINGDPEDKEWQWGVDKIPARALLLAFLEALIAEEDQ